MVPISGLCAGIAVDAAFHMPIAHSVHCASRVADVGHVDEVSPVPRGFAATQHVLSPTEQPGGTWPPKSPPPPDHRPAETSKQEKQEWNMRELKGRTARTVVVVTLIVSALVLALDQPVRAVSDVETESAPGVMTAALLG